MSPYILALFVMTNKLINLNGSGQDINKYFMEQSYTGILDNNENICTETTICINNNNSHK